MATELSHQELSLLLFALEGPHRRQGPESSPSCEEACPVTSHFEELFAAGSISPEKQLVRHLNNHLREALLECGMLELMGAVEHGPPLTLSPEDQANLQRMNHRLSKWSCKVNIGSSERRMLYEAIARLPRSAWMSMPRTLWRLRKKLKASY